MGGSRPQRASAWKKLRRQCFLRDKAAHAECWICHGERGPIDYSVEPSSTPLSYEPDHYLPVSQHPELELAASNVRAAHRCCNRQRGNRAGLDSIGQRSRRW